MADDDGRTIRPFADFLRDQNKGKTHDELSTALNDLVNAVTLHEKGGTLTLKIEVKPMEKGTGDVLLVTDDITVKMPKAKRKPSVFFPDADGNLRRNDPNQMTFDTLTGIDGEREPDVRERAAGDQ